MLRQEHRIVTVMVLVEVLSSLALGATATALGWQAYGRQRDPLVLGLLGLAEFIPALLLALPAGHVIDRHDRRVVAGAGLVAAAAIAVALALDAAAGDTAVWPLYVLAFGWGVGNAFIGPALGPLLAAGIDAPDLAQTFALVDLGGPGRDGDRARPWAASPSRSARRRRICSQRHSARRRRRSCRSCRAGSAWRTSASTSRGWPTCSRACA